LDGVNLITRPVWRREKKTTPDASPFFVKVRRVQIGFLYLIRFFFIPNERVLCGEWEYGRRLACFFADSLFVIVIAAAPPGAF